MKNTGRFLINGLMLSAVSLILRTAGVAFNAAVNSRLGAAGTGLFSLVNSVFSPALTLATAGVSLAVSRLIAEELDKEGNGASRAVLRKAALASLALSSSVAFLLFSLSGYISREWLGDGAAAPLLKLLSLSLPFVALSSASSGYFIGVRRVSRNAGVQLFEQFFKIALTLFALTRTLPEAKSCLAAILLCSLASDILSCLISLFLLKRDSRRLGKGKKGSGVLRRLLSVILPVSVSSFLRSGLVAWEHILIPQGLKKNGASYESAMASYGALTGMAMPILFFPASFLYSFTGLLVPEFAEAKENGERAVIASAARRVVRTVLIFSVGASAVLLGFSYDLGMAVYHSEEAARYLKIMAPLIPLMYLDTAVDSILKGLGEQVFGMKVNVADALLSVLAVRFLVPAAGLNGYIFILFASEAFNFALSLRRLTKVTGVSFPLLRQAALPLLASCGAVSLSHLFFHLSPALNSGTPLATATGIALSSSLYFLFLLLFGVIPHGLPLRLLKKLFAALPAREGKGSFGAGA